MRDIDFIYKKSSGKNNIFCFNLAQISGKSKSHNFGFLKGDW